jgi:hypothetical protein
MIELFGIKLTYDTISFLLLFLSSELIGTNPNVRANGVLQLIVNAANTFKPIRKEDDTVEEIKQLIEDLKRDLGA